MSAREDVGVALHLLATGGTDPDLWTRDQRAAVSRLHAFRDGRPTTEGDADRGAAPGVYNADQANREVPGTAVQVEELHARIALLEQRNGALDANARAAQERLARLHSDHDRLLDDLVAVARSRDALGRELTHARSLEGALDTLGITRRQLDAGQAVDLCGHPYVSRDLLRIGQPGPVDAEAPGPLSDTLPRLNVEGTALMSEAAGGVFVPIPEGHMLSVTVTPYAAD